MRELADEVIRRPRHRKADTSWIVSAYFISEYRYSTLLNSLMTAAPPQKDPNRPKTGFRELSNGESDEVSLQQGSASRCIVHVHRNTGLLIGIVDYVVLYG